MAGSDPRQKLLEAAVSYASRHGVSDLSLRELAQAIGTSHRMLHYHFGSREGLLVAIVEANEAEQRATVADALDGADTTAIDVMRRVWNRLADPEMWPSERLFFELYGQALQGRPGTTALLDGIVTSWIEPGSDVLRRQGLAPADARAASRLSVAVVRGLLLDLLATGDRVGVDAAVDYFLDLSATVSAPGSPPSGG
jgi:AcrR family transcriptional regulator